MKGGRNENGELLPLREYLVQYLNFDVFIFTTNIANLSNIQI